MKAIFTRTMAVLEGPIARGSLIGVLVRLSGLALIFVQSVIAARLLGVSEYGVVTLLLSIAQLAAGFALFGYGSLAVGEIPRRLKQGQAKVAMTFARHAIGRIALLCLLAIPATYAAALFFLETVPLGLALPLLISIPLLAAIQLFRGVAVGLERPFWGVAPGELIRPALLVGTLIIAGFSIELDSASFMLLYMATALIAFLVAAPTIRKRQLPSDSVPEKADVEKPDWDRTALPFLGIHFAAILQLELATLMLGLFATPEAVGLFQPISRISMLLMLPFYGLSVGFTPRVAALHAEGKLADIARLSRKHTLASTGALVIAGGGIGLLAPYILMIFGPEFVAGAPLVWLLVAGRIVQAACGPGAEVLAMTQNSGRAVMGLSAGLLVEALAAVMLIPAYGMTGAAIAVAMGLVARSLTLTLTVIAVLGINPSYAPPGLGHAKSGRNRAIKDA